jgi:hypothetical protein
MLLALSLLSAGCGEPSSPAVTGDGDAGTEAASRPADRAGGDSASSAAVGPVFEDRARETGVDFVHFNGMAGEFYIPEVTGTGVGMLDYDGDGDMDLYLVQGRMLGPGKTPADVLVPWPGKGPLIDRLYRNDLEIGADGSRTLHFTDVTGEIGLVSDGYGMGVVTGDYDNDGWIDLYVTNLKSNRLLRNRGDGTFEDVTDRAGADDPRWSVPAVFFDYDRDGWLDLFVGNYLDFNYDNHKTCLTVTGARDYCDPSAYNGEPDRLLHNEGDGTFRDVTRESGLYTAYGPALGAVAADLTGDGWIDLYVANDGQPNQMWINRGDGVFEDTSLMGGSAVNAEGFAEASMGVDAADFDGDGDLDLFMAHISGETNTLYRNDGTGLFEDSSILTGLGPASKWATGFGAGSLDYDNDGWLDVLTVNGAVRTIEEEARQGIPYPLRQPNQLFRNQGQGRFREVSDRGGEALAVSEVSRGAAFGDVDNDGDTDVLVLNSNGPIQLLINRIGQDRSWLGLRLVTGDPPRDALGARVGLVRQGEPTLWRRVRTDASFASANDPRVLFGLGDSNRVERIRVEWPGGRVEEWTDVPVNRYTTLAEGEGREVTP